MNIRKKKQLISLLVEYKQSLTESSGCDCNIFKAKDGKWYLQLQTRRGSEEYNYYGPFANDDEADRYLSRRFSNPGDLGVDGRGSRPVPKDARK